MGWKRNSEWFVCLRIKGWEKILDSSRVSDDWVWKSRCICIFIDIYVGAWGASYYSAYTTEKMVLVYEHTCAIRRKRQKEVVEQEEEEWRRRRPGETSVMRGPRKPRQEEWRKGPGVSMSVVKPIFLSLSLFLSPSHVNETKQWGQAKESAREWGSTR